MGQGATVNSADLANQDLDAATANFDNTFTRMPVNTDEGAEQQLDDAEAAEQLNEDTFVGFTFDDIDRQAEPPVAGRQRTQHHHEPAPHQPRTLD